MLPSYQTLQNRQDKYEYRTRLAIMKLERLLKEATECQHCSQKTILGKYCKYCVEIGLKEDKEAEHIRRRINMKHCHCGKGIHPKWTICSECKQRKLSTGQGLQDNNSGKIKVSDC